MKNKIIGFLIALIALLGGGYGVQKLGGSSEGGADTATTTLASWGGTYRVLKTNSSVLRNVVLASTTPTLAATATMTFKNATSTTDVSSTTIATVGYNTGTGTYTFNAAAPRGLIVEVGVGVSGGYTFTYQ